MRLAVKFLVDNPEYAGRSAKAQFHALELAREHGVPAPEPLLLDETGEVFGVPGVVTRFVDGRQVANPLDPLKWAQELAQLLVRIHAIRPGDRSREHLFDGNHQVLYFLRGDRPRTSAEHPLSADIFQAVRDLQSAVVEVPSVLVHMDYWPGNVLWHEDRISAVLDWDFGAYRDPAIDVAFFRMNMYLRGIKEAADIFLRSYEETSGMVVRNLGFMELTAAAQPLPDPALWIPASREMGDSEATDERAATDYYEFVSGALCRAYTGR